MKTIHEVASLAGVASSTLRHYDEIGLLKPAARSDAGYRLYGREELLRLREIVIWRELGFPLGEIARLVEDPDHDRLAALQRQLELTGTHRDRLARITQGLESAITAIRQGRSLTEDDIFAGFALGVTDEDGEGATRRPATSEEPKRVATFAFLSDRARSRRRSDPDDPDLPIRICVTDPIRLAEPLLALGILPVGAGTYEDRFSEQLGVWPWSPLIEAPVREEILDVGYYGSDVNRIEASKPDLIFELFLPSKGVNLAQHLSDGRYDLEALTRVAPTKLFDIDPHAIPGFTARLMQVAAVLGLTADAQLLLAVWAARTSVVRSHLAGAVVSALSCWNEELFMPTPLHTAQVLTSVGLVPTSASGRASADGRNVYLDDTSIRDLNAPTLLLHTRYLERDQVGRLLADKLAKSISAVRNGRVIGLGMEAINSGWFGAHWQLQLIARAYGLVLLRAGQGAEAVHAAVNPRDDRLSVATPRADGSVVFNGPYLRRQSLLLSSDQATVLQLDPGGGAHMVQFAEMYTSVREDGVTHPFSGDRESALERIALRAHRVHSAKGPRIASRPFAAGVRG